MSEKNSLKSSFRFTETNLDVAHEIISRYPKGRERSAIMPLLYLAQEQNDNWISSSAMDYIAVLLNIPAIYVYEVANFYTMYNKKPVGKYLIQVCRTTPCWLCGSEKILETCKNALGIDVKDTTKDNLFTLIEVECLGACVNAPVVQINNDYYEKLDENEMIAILNNLKANAKPEKN